MQELFYMWCKNYWLALKGSPKISNKGNLSEIRARPKLGYLTLFHCSLFRLLHAGSLCWWINEQVTNFYSNFRWQASYYIFKHIFWVVMPCNENWTSACTNQTWGSKVQNRGSLTLTGTLVSVADVAIVESKWRISEWSAWLRLAVKWKGCQCQS